MYEDIRQNFPLDDLSHEKLSDRDCLDIREFLTFDDLVKVQLLVSIKIIRLEDSLNIYLQCGFDDIIFDTKKEISYYTDLYNDLQRLISNY